MATSPQDATTFARNFIATINGFLNAQDDMNRANDRLAKDPALADAAAAAMNAAGRPALTGQDFTNAATAIQQVQFTLQSGTPELISYFYALL
jgi:hypothetical protein